MLLDVGGWIDVCRDAPEEAVDLDAVVVGCVAEEDDDVVTELLVVAAVLLLGLLDPPYVQPSPRGIDGP